MLIETSFKIENGKLRYYNSEELLNIIHAAWVDNVWAIFN